MAKDNGQTGGEEKDGQIQRVMTERERKIQVVLLNSTASPTKPNTAEKLERRKEWKKRKKGELFCFAFFLFLCVVFLCVVPTAPCRLSVAVWSSHSSLVALHCPPLSNQLQIFSRGARSDRLSQLLPTQLLKLSAQLETGSAQSEAFWLT